MTYSVIARCARTNEIGIAVATYSLACGSFTQGAHCGAGVTMTQANVRKGNAYIGRRLLAQGLSSRSVLTALVQDDQHASLRQIAVMTRDGLATLHTGTAVAGWAGGTVDTDLVAFGNVLAGEQVVDGMVAAFRAAPEQPLVNRLIRALEAGRDAGGQSAGGQPLPERSACVVVTGEKEQAAWDLRVDLHGTAVSELRRVYQGFASYQRYYEDRDEDPSRCLSQVAWERENLTETKLEELLK